MTCQAGGATTPQMGWGRHAECRMEKAIRTRMGCYVHADDDMSPSVCQTSEALESNRTWVNERVGTDGSYGILKQKRDERAGMRRGYRGFVGQVGG